MYCSLSMDRDRDVAEEWVGQGWNVAQEWIGKEQGCSPGMSWAETGM
jgi:hypothetical protein